jgi:curved DNA-binding protein CbpA
MKHFTKVTTLNELKVAYKKLVMQFHPDLNRGTDTTKVMQDINKEYEILFKELKNVKANNEQEQKDMDAHELDDGYREFIFKIISLESINIELRGSWIWVNGSTSPVKDNLKEAGMKFKGATKEWYWFPRLQNKEEFKKRNGHSSWSTEKIKSVYGSTTIKPPTPPKLLK